MKLSLSSAGLSMTLAQSISNLLNQRANMLVNQLTTANNATKTIKVDGDTYVFQVGKPLPDDAIQVLLEVAQLRATQAFLMENIKGKAALLTEIKQSQLAFPLEPPVRAPYAVGVYRHTMTEEEGLNELSVAEASDFLEVEAYAAHIGQFIHAKTPLDILRADLAKAQPMEWHTIGMNTPSAKQVPVHVERHHSEAQLLALHTKLAGLHRRYEQRVNYFKTKVKNLVTEYNAQVARDNAVEEGRVNTVNAGINEAYGAAMGAYNGAYNLALQAFEAERQEKVLAASNLKIAVGPRFQEVITQFKQLLEPEQGDAGESPVTESLEA